jgi:hypothetical protein
MPLSQSTHHFWRLEIIMTQAQFSNLSQRLSEAANTDPFGAHHTELHQQFNAALSQPFDEGERADMEAQFDARHDYMHLAYSSF